MEKEEDSFEQQIIIKQKRKHNPDIRMYKSIVSDSNVSHSKENKREA